MNKNNRLKKGKITPSFYLYLWKLRLQNLSKSFYCKFISPHLFAIASIFYFLTILILSNKLSTFPLEPFFSKDGVTFFTAVGAMLGGVLAIVFSLSTFLIQNAAQRMSSGFYDTVAKDRLHDFIFWIIAIFTFIFFILAIIFTSLSALNNRFLDIIAHFSIFAIGLILWLLFVLFKRIYARIRPINSLLIIKKDVIHYLNSLKKVAQKMSTVIKKHPEVSSNLSNEMALAVSFQSLSPHFDFVNSRLDYLFDYHDKLLAQQEKRMARATLTTVCHILKHYFQLRSDSSVILPSSEVFLVGVSDSQGFLTPSLEHIVSEGNSYMKNCDDVGIAHAISILSDLTISAQNVKYTSDAQTENPIFAQCRGYLDQLMEAAIKQGNMEALYQGARAYARIGNAAIESRLQDQLSATFKVLNEIAYHALLKRYDVVWGQVIDTYKVLLQNFIMTWPSFNFDICLKSLFEHLQSNILRVYQSLKIGIVRHGLIMQLKVDIPFLQIERLIFEIAKRVNQTENTKELKSWKNKFMTLVEELYNTLRYLSEQMKSVNDPLVNTLGNIIAGIGCLLLELSKKEKWSEEQQALLDMAGWYLHQPWRFIHHAAEEEINDISLDSLVEAVAKIGLLSLQVNEDKTSKESIGLLSDIASKMLKEGKSPSTAVRIMERACYIGILALKFKKRDLVAEAKGKIDIFQKAYGTKYSTLNQSSLPRQDQLKIEIIKLRRDVEKAKYDQARTIFDRAKDRLLKEIDVLNIDRFTFEIWKSFVSGSPLEKELKIEEKIEKNTAGPQTQ